MFVFSKKCVFLHRLAGKKTQKTKKTNNKKTKSCARHGFRVFIMKKLVLSALVMSALFFASCGGGTKAFKDATKICDDYEKALGKVKSCEDLKNARKDFREAKNKYRDTEYGDKEKMTPEEEDKMIIRNAELQVKENEKGRKYECDGYKKDK